MKKFLACTALSVFLLSGCSLFKSEGIIKVNDTVITKAEFEKLQQYEIEKGIAGTDKAIIKPRLDVAGYVNSLVERWTTEGVSASNIATLKNKLTKFYDENKEAFYRRTT